MTPSVKRPKRCKVCKVLIREENKSELCHYHQISYLATLKRKRDREIKENI